MDKEDFHPKPLLPSQQQVLTFFPHCDENLSKRKIPVAGGALDGAQGTNPPRSWIQAPLTLLLLKMHLFPPNNIRGCFLRPQGGENVDPACGSEETR